MLYLKDMAKKFKQYCNIDEEQIQQQLLLFANNTGKRKKMTNTDIISTENLKEILEQLNKKSREN